VYAAAIALRASRPAPKHFHDCTEKSAIMRADNSDISTADFANSGAGRATAVYIYLCIVKYEANSLKSVKCETALRRLYHSRLHQEFIAKF
jgi:hypothetical protein